jgi:nucleotide-binding universal stress UspA family protein
LSDRSQETLRFAVQLAEASRSRLSAFHAIAKKWLDTSIENISEIERDVEVEILNAVDRERNPVEFDVIVSRSSDPASEIIRLSRSLRADLIVMKARPGVLSALHFGSIVERVTSRAACPVMLLPSRFLAAHDPSEARLRFRKVLFDYDFSQATDELFRLANALARNFDSELHLLSVLEPPHSDMQVSSFDHSRSLLETAIQGRLCSASQDLGRSAVDIQTTIEWGPHADRILKYAQMHEIDLVCTALPAPSYSLERIYRKYFGQLLAAARCPILVKQCV